MLISVDFCKSMYGYAMDSQTREGPLGLAALRSSTKVKLKRW